MAGIYMVYSPQYVVLSRVGVSSISTHHPYFQLLTQLNAELQMRLGSPRLQWEGGRKLWMAAPRVQRKILGLHHPTQGPTLSRCSNYALMLVASQHQVSKEMTIFDTKQKCLSQTKLKNNKLMLINNKSKDKYQV